MTVAPLRSRAPSEAAVESAVWRALDTVRDPELDQPITELSFVSEVACGPGSGGGDGLDVLVRLRLPTYFCAPNFAYLMVADARDAVAAIAGVGSVVVRLDDHFASEEINAGVGGDGFDGAFAGQTESADLEELRQTFRRKAYLAALERVCGHLVTDRDLDASELTSYRLADAAAVPGYAGLLRRRREIGLADEADAPLFVDQDGSRIEAEQAVRRLRFAKAVRVSIAGNATFCRGLLRTRYGTSED